MTSARWQYLRDIAPIQLPDELHKRLDQQARTNITVALAKLTARSK